MICVGKGPSAALGMTSGGVNRQVQITRTSEIWDFRQEARRAASAPARKKSRKRNGPGARRCRSLSHPERSEGYHHRHATAVLAFALDHEVTSLRSGRQNRPLTSVLNAVDVSASRSRRNCFPRSIFLRGRCRAGCAQGQSLVGGLLGALVRPRAPAVGIRLALASLSRLVLCERRRFAISATVIRDRPTIPRMSSPRRHADTLKCLVVGRLERSSMTSTTRREF